MEVTGTSPSIILLPMAALALAALVLIVLWYWWSSSKKEAKADTKRRTAISQPDEPEASVQPAMTSTPVPSQPHSPTEIPAQDGAVEVLRVLRDLADGSLLVEIGGQRYRNLTEITDREVGRRFLGNAQALAKFARVGEFEVPDSWAQPAIPPAPPPTPPSATPATPTAKEWQSAPQQPLPSSLAGSVSNRPGSEDDAPKRRGLLRFGIGDKEPPETYLPTLPMAEQIDEILQYRLTQNPDLAHRSIRVQSAPGGGVQIVVDGKSYDSVGDVEDDAAREFIKASIREWEESQ